MKRVAPLPVCILAKSFKDAYVISCNVYIFDYWLLVLLLALLLYVGYAALTSEMFLLSLNT